jgi:hypothetical protein
MMFKKIALVVGIGLLVGCASPKRAMLAHEYTAMGQVWVKWDRCIKAGLVSPDIGALGIRYIKAGIAETTYDQGLINSAVSKAAAEFPHAEPAFCNSMATFAMQKKQEIDLHNDSIANQQQILQNAINNSPRQVYCNTVAGTTMCSGM